MRCAYTVNKRWGEEEKIRNPKKGLEETNITMHFAV